MHAQFVFAINFDCATKIGGVAAFTLNCVATPSALPFIIAYTLPAAIRSTNFPGTFFAGGTATSDSRAVTNDCAGVIYAAIGTKQIFIEFDGVTTDAGHAQNIYATGQVLCS